MSDRAAIDVLADGHGFTSVYLVNVLDAGDLSYYGSSMGFLVGISEDGVRAMAFPDGDCPGIPGYVWIRPEAMADRLEELFCGEIRLRPAAPLWDAYEAERSRKVVSIVVPAVVIVVMAGLGVGLAVAVDMVGKRKERI